MPTPTEHKTIQTRILEYAGLRRPVGYEVQEAIHLRGSFGGQVVGRLCRRRKQSSEAGLSMCGR